VTLSATYSRCDSLQRADRSGTSSPRRNGSVFTPLCDSYYHEAGEELTSARNCGRQPPRDPLPPPASRRTVPRTATPETTRRSARLKWPALSCTAALPCEPALGTAVASAAVTSRSASARAAARTRGVLWPTSALQPAITSEYNDSSLSEYLLGAARSRI
jgi:hypothetical protein